MRNARSHRKRRNDARVLDYQRRVAISAVMKPREMNVDLKDDVLHWEGGATQLIVASTLKSI